MTIKRPLILENAGNDVSVYYIYMRDYQIIQQNNEGKTSTKVLNETNDKERVQKVQVNDYTMHGKRKTRQYPIL